MLKQIAIYKFNAAAYKIFKRFFILRKGISV